MRTEHLIFISLYLLVNVMIFRSSLLMDVIILVIKYDLNTEWLRLHFAIETFKKSLEFSLSTVSTFFEALVLKRNRKHFADEKFAKLFLHT